MKHNIIPTTIVLCALSVVSFAAEPLPPHLERDGNVRFYVYHLDEFLKIRYAENSRWRENAERQLKKIFRSRGDNEEQPLDHRLIELADHLQDHFGADTVEVISAYRSPVFNKALKETGHNVADKSLHMQGLAMDIHLDEIRESDLRDYLKSLGLGGVGYYGNKLMVHMDFGPVRFWQDGAFSENTEIGVFNQKNPLKIRTDKLNYAPDEIVTFKFSPPLTGKTRAVLEKFQHGKWLAVESWEGQEISGSWKRVIQNKCFPNLTRFGKFRLHFENTGDWQNSNEFYVKKQCAAC